MRRLPARSFKICSAVFLLAASLSVQACKQPSAARGTQAPKTQPAPIEEVAHVERPATHAQFRKSGGFISLWLGKKGVSELELDEYLHNQFESDFGFAIYGPDAPEYSAEGSSRGIRDLLTDFSVAATFVDAAIEAANRLGWTEATTAVIFYNFEYDRKFDRSTDKSPIRFVGVLRYPGF